MRSSTKNIFPHKIDKNTSECYNVFSTNDKTIVARGGNNEKRRVT